MMPGIPEKPKQNQAHPQAGEPGFCLGFQQAQLRARHGRGAIDHGRERVSGFVRGLR